jgi:beta-xylosidase
MPCSRRSWRDREPTHPPERLLLPYLMGGNHAPVEGPFIEYNPETDYYYLFLS